MSENKKVFDDYAELCECLKCDCYYNNQCDGSPRVATKDPYEPCKAFVATRRVIIPQDIENLKKSVRSLERSDFVWGLILLFHLLTHLLGSWLGW